MLAEGAVGVDHLCEDRSQTAVEDRPCACVRACGVNTDILMDSISALTVFHRFLEGSKPSVDPIVFLVARHLEKPNNSL